MPPHGRNRRGRDVEGISFDAARRLSVSHLVRTGPLGVGYTTEEVPERREVPGLGRRAGIGRRADGYIGRCGGNAQGGSAL